jgi:two-component system phosphate regulon response regulator PhoB
MNTPRHDSAVLIVEDEQDLLELLQFNLSREGYDVTTAATGEEALRAVNRSELDLILLDLMLPAISGLEVCRHLKKDPRTAPIPVIMLTARGEESDIVRGLELGADDYITKPFSPRVLLARIKAVLRRAEGERQAAGAPRRIIEAGQVRLDRERHEVTVADEVIDLTATEFKLLGLLAARPGRVFTRQQIIEAIHDGFAAVTDRSVDVLVVALRRKLGEAGEELETVRGVGYRFKS